MNLQQLRFVHEAARRNLNLTETARALHTSQPGVSRAILELEEELGVDIFARHGKRLRRITEPGEAVLRSVEIILREVANLKRIGEAYAREDSGTLSIATTHTQARYALPGPIARWRQRFPKVQIELHQGTPDQVVRMLLDDVAVIGLATESLAEHPDLITLPCYPWQHVVVVPRGHPLLREAGADGSGLTLEMLVREPLVTYHATVTGRSRIDAAFARAGLKPEVALEALDSDVIKTYVRVGLGVGILAEMAMQPERALGDPNADADLVALPAGALFGHNLTRVGFHRGIYLRDYVLAFAEEISPTLDRAGIRAALQGTGEAYEL